MRWYHLLLGIVAMAMWGANGTVCRATMVDAFPPFLFISLRMLISALPLVFFVPRPPFRSLAFWGVVAAVFSHNAFHLYAFRHGIGAGTSMLVMQTQVFVTIFFAATLLKEYIFSITWIAVLVAFGGLVLVAHSMHLAMGAPFYAFLLVVLAAVSLGTNNIMVRLLREVNVWSLVAWPALLQAGGAFLLALCVEGPMEVAYYLSHLSNNQLWALAYNGWGAGIIAFGSWIYLLHTYEASKAIPLSLLLPIFAVATGVIFLNEPLTTELFIGGSLVLFSVAVVQIPPLRLWAERNIHHVALCFRR